MTEESININLDYELLYSSGYLVASAAFFLSKYSQTSIFLLSRKEWEKSFPYFDWGSLKDSFPTLIEQGYLQSAKAGNNDHWLLSRANPSAPNWKLSKSVTMNLKQHGLTPRAVENYLRSFTLSYRYGLNRPCTELDELFTKFALAEHYIDKSTFKPVVITTDWTPQEETVNFLVAKQIPKDFIEGRVFEFALYWSEVGFPRRSYENTFKSFITSCWNAEKYSIQ